MTMPPGNQTWKWFSFVVLSSGKQRCDQRIARRLDGAVGDAEDQVRGEQAPEVPGEDGEQDADQVPDEGKADDAAEADEVAQRAAEDHRHRESPERRGDHLADLLMGEVKLGRPRRPRHPPRMAKLIAVTTRAIRLARKRRLAFMYLASGF